jgi:hypothetical protein
MERRQRMTHAPTLVKHEPRLIEIPTHKMAVVHTVGDPNDLTPLVLPALYGTVYKLKFDLKREGRKFEVEPLRARWPDADVEPKDRWHAIWGLPAPMDPLTLRQRDPEIRIDLEVWVYGMTAEILHIGPYDDEKPAIGELREFITRSGYEIAGDHEEEYLTPLDAKVQKTIIRYPVRKVRPMTMPRHVPEQVLAEIFGPRYWLETEAQYGIAAKGL